MFVLKSSQNFLTKNTNVMDWQCCLKQISKEANIFFYFPWPVREVGLLIWMFCLLYLQVIESSFFLLFTHPLVS